MIRCSFYNFGQHPVQNSLGHQIDSRLAKDGDYIQSRLLPCKIHDRLSGDPDRFFPQMDLQ